jgi:hypothetical protein
VATGHVGGWRTAGDLPCGRPVSELKCTAKQSNNFEYCLTDFAQMQRMKLVHLQRFKGRSVIEGTEMGRALSFFNNQNLILLQANRQEVI